MRLVDIMKKDKKLFESKASEVLVMEDMGNLDIIKPEFQKVFASNYGSYGHGKNNKIAVGSVGKESPVETTEIKSIKDAYTDLFAGKTVGVILRLDGEQVIAVGPVIKDMNYNYKSTNDVQVMIDYKKLGELGFSKEDLDNLAKKISNYSFARSFISSDKLSVAKAKTILSTFYKVTKTLVDGVVDAIVVYPDADRKEKKQERSAAKHGALAIEVKSSKFKESARRDLMSRLDKFKASKAASYATPEEFFKAIFEKGYMDKVIIGGYTYEKQTSDLRLGDIQNPEKSWGTVMNTVNYRLDEKNSPKYDDMWERRMAIVTAQKDGKISEEEAKAQLTGLKQECPREIKIVFGLQGASIVPKDIQIVGQY